MNMKFVKAVAVLIIITVLGYAAGTLSERPKPPAVVSHGTAEIGGLFELIDVSGVVVTDQSLLGRYSLIYFGYTNCPDVCPLDMNRISMAVEILEEGGGLENLQPVFISIDPARDTPEVVGAFLRQYHPSFIGLTGTPAQIEVAAKAYKVAYEDMLAAEDKPLINHSSHIYLMDEAGKYITHFGPEASPSALAEALRGYLAQS